MVKSTRKKTTKNKDSSPPPSSTSHRQSPPSSSESYFQPPTSSSTSHLQPLSSSASLSQPSSSASLPTSSVPSRHTINVSPAPSAPKTIDYPTFLANKNKAMAEISTVLKQFKGENDKTQRMKRAISDTYYAKKNEFHKTIDSDGEPTIPTIDYKLLRQQHILIKESNLKARQYLRIANILLEKIHAEPKLNDYVASLNMKPGASKSMQIKHDVKEKPDLMSRLKELSDYMPVWFPKDKHERLPPLCGAVEPPENYICKTSEQVAAMVPGSDGVVNCILAAVRGYNPDTEIYQIVDIDGEKSIHNLHRNQVTPLPVYKIGSNLFWDCVYPIGSIIMALYPRTTCFYKALIEQVPKLPNLTYKVQFEDTTYPSGYSPSMEVSQRYVISFRSTPADEYIDQSASSSSSSDSCVEEDDRSANTILSEYGQRNDFSDLIPITSDMSESDKEKSRTKGSSPHRESSKRRNK